MDVQVLMDGQHACEGIARELRSATPHDIDILSFSGRKELDKQDDHSLFDTSIQGEVERVKFLRTQVSLYLSWILQAIFK